VHDVQLPASSWHWKLPVSVDVKVKLAPVEVLGLLGVEPIVVSGAIESTDQVYAAGVASVFPAASVAFTEKVWLPCARAL
jgi:hypothetical protein